MEVTVLREPEDVHAACSLFAERYQFTELTRVVDDPVVWLMRELKNGR